MADEPSPSLAKLAARELRRAEAAAPARSDDERDAHIALLTATLREERARASRRRIVGVALGIAAVLVAAIGLRAVLTSARGVSPPPAPAPVAARYDLHVEGSGAAVARAGAPTSPQELLRAHDRVTSKSGPVALVVGTGTRLTLDEGGDLEIVEEGRSQLFSLGAGGVRADVAKLHEGERFVVRTEDTEVEVRGTSFRVERVEDAAACRPALHTRVIVTEGVVVVRHAGVEDRVKAGEQWPPPCVPAPVESSSPRPVAPSAPSAPSAPGPSVAPLTPAPSVTGPRSKLAASNELFANAQAARRSGDTAGAVALFDKLLAEYPSSPIVESATVERMRALDQLDHKRSVAAARDYLARFPHGFARGEAEAIVALGF